MKGERVPTLELARDDVEHFGHDGRLEIVGVVPSDAFISPDDPMVRDPFRAAMIYPDKPILRAEEEAGVVGCGSEWGRLVPLRRPTRVPGAASRYAQRQPSPSRVRESGTRSPMRSRAGGTKEAETVLVAGYEPAASFTIRTSGMIFGRVLAANEICRMLSTLFISKRHSSP